jgi:hypothetical protein
VTNSAPNLSASQLEDFRFWLLGDMKNGHPGASSIESHTIETMFEHHLLSKLLQECFFARRKTLSILRAEIDNEGYDLVLETADQVRHVQLKASEESASRFKDVNRRLADRRDGHIIWMVYSVSETTWQATVLYRWTNTETLPTRKASKPSQVRLKPSDFTEFTEVSDLFDALFPGIPRINPVPALIPESGA